jgi:hypothetical protein
MIQETSMVRAYIRCNGGDFFGTKHCPIDGWTGPWIVEFLDALGKIKAEGKEPTLSAFRDLTVSESVLRNMLVIEFGDSQMASSSRC